MGLLAFVFGYTTVEAGITPRPPDTLTGSVVILETSINALARPSADYRTILQHILDTLPPGSQDFVRSDINTFMSRAPAKGADFKCGADFVRYRARNELLRIKDTLLSNNPQPAQPQFCYAVPFAIDPAQARNPIEIYGYDFDRVPIEILLMDSYGFQDVGFAVTKKSHYHLTVDLAQKGVKLSPQNRVLAVTWGHLIQHSIPIIQSDTPICSSRIEEIAAGKEITYAPVTINGGKHFSGSQAKVFANAFLDYESNKVDATVCMTALGQDSRAGISGCGVEYVYTSEAEREIEWVFGNLEAAILPKRVNRADYTLKGGAGSPIDLWIFGGFGRRSAVNAESQVTIRLRKLRVVSTAAEGCISAISYLEAKRMNALSAGTVRRLDPQLRNVDRAILKLRPRFAPPIHSR